MTQAMTSDRTLTLEAPEIIELSSWMAGFNRDLPTRVMTAISAGRGIVLVSSPGGVAPELQAVIVSRLQAADLVSLSLTAPLGSLAALRTTISQALPGSDAAGQPLVILIDKAEALSAEMLGRLRALVALRRKGQPALHVLLIAPPSVRPLLHQSGLDDLWDDATAHIRLVPELAACLPDSISRSAPPARPGTWLPPPKLPPVSPSRLLRPTAPRLASLAMAGFALAGYAAFFHQSSSEPARTIVADARTWHVDRPAPALPLAMSPATVPPVSMPASTAPARSAPVAPSPDVASPSVASPSAASPSAASPSAASLGGMPLHVTVRYQRGSPAAAARAALLLSQLRRQGILADGPSPALGKVSHLGYGFAQDGAAAADLARRLKLAAPRLSQPGPGDASLSRPGEISIFIGASGHVGRVLQAKVST